MDQARISMTARRGPLAVQSAAARSSMLAQLAGGSVSARGGGDVAPSPMASDYYYAAAAPPASDSLVPGVPDWALAAGGVAFAAVAVLVLRRKKSKR